MRVERVKGTRDFSLEEMRKRDYVEKEILDVLESYNYGRILFPTFEYSELFEKKSGEEILQHMYVFKDKSGRRLCLRPEATASVCRMFAESLREKQKPLKLYYSCPMFRYEEPQKGRYREFWQIGVELIGPKSAESDAEVISIAYESLKKLGLKFELEIGHLGILRGLMSDLEIKEEIQDRVVACIDKKDEKCLKELVDDRILFELLKLKGGRETIENAEGLLKESPNSIKALKELKNVLYWLDLLEINYVIDLGISRGLEYYTGTVFEIRVKELGAQNQICGGGRYDNLIELFSGLKMPATGFAFGFDRVMDAMKMQEIEIPKKELDIVIAPVNSAVKGEALKIASELRKKFSVDVDLMDRKLGRILEYAGNINAKYTVIVGPDDLKDNEVTLRDMRTGEQKKIKIDEIRDQFHALMPV